MNEGEEAVLSAIANGDQPVGDDLITTLRTNNNQITVGMHTRKVHHSITHSGQSRFLGKIGDETFDKLLEYIALHNTIKEL